MTAAHEAPLDLTFPVGAGALPAVAFQAIVDRTAHVVVVIDRAGTFLYVGGSSEEYLGWPASELLGRNMTEYLTPEGIIDAMEVMAEIEGGDRVGSGVPMVFEILQPDATTAWIEIGAIPLLDVPGVDGVALRCRPWTGQRDLEEFLASLLADAPLDEVLTRLCRSIAASLQAGGVAIHHAFDGKEFGAVASSAVPEACLVGRGPWREVLVTEAAVNACDVSGLPGTMAAAARDAGFHTCWTARIPVSQGVSPAALTIWRPQPGPMMRSHRQVLERSLRYVQLALVLRAEHQRLRHLAGHDALTGVANRREFRSRLAAALAIGDRDFAVAFCDLDGFKIINDTFGHARGDEVLVDVADRLRAGLRSGDELARMGGDEFTVLIRKVVDASAAELVVQRLLDALRDPLIVNGTEVTLGLSIGVALAGPESTADSLLTQADEALYAVKSAGGGAAMVSGGG